MLGIKQQITLVICSITMKMRKMRKKREKDVLGCAEQPLWQKILRTTAIYLIKTLNILFTLFVFFVFIAVLIEIKKSFVQWYALLIIGYIFITMCLFEIYSTKKTYTETIEILFVLSYLITYCVVLRYN